MKKKILIFLVLAAASALFFSAAYIRAGADRINPFDRSFTFENLSYAVTDKNGNSYVIDRSMRRIVRLGKDGVVDFIIDGGRKDQGSFFYAYELAVDSEGYLYVINGVLDDEGFFMQREEVLRYTPSGEFDRVIYSKIYGEDEKKPELVQRGEFISLHSGKETVEWCVVDAKGIHPMRIIISKGVVERLTSYPLASADLLVSGAVRLPGGSVVYSTKKGKIIRSGKNGAEEIYSADDQQGALSIPWWVDADSKGTIYFSDLGRRTICRLAVEGKVETVLSREMIEKAGFQSGSFVYYRFSAGDSGAITSCNDYFLVTLDPATKRITRYSDGGVYPLSAVFFRALFWLLLLFGIALFAAACWYFYRHILKSRVTLMFKQLVIFIPMLVVSVSVPAKLIIDDYSQRYKDELSRKISLLVQAAPRAVNPDDIDAVVKQSDYLGESYLRVRESLLQSFNYSRDDWNRGFYFVVYRVRGDSLFGFMYQNGGIGTYYPFSFFDDPQSIYRQAYKGNIVSESVSDVWGSWLYGVGPIFGKDGRVTALIEVGTDLYSYTRENNRLMQQMVMRVCIITVVFSLLLVGVTYFLLISIRRLRTGVNRLSKGEWNTKVNIGRRHDEVGELADGFNRMSDYILNYIGEIVNLNKGYHRFVPEQFLRYLDKESVTQIQLGDQVQKVMTVMFSDIRSFTTLSEKMTPKENFDFLNAYLGHVGPVIRANNGFIDKYIGDAIMALFPHTADDAVAAALGMFEKLDAYNERRVAKGYEPIRIGLGLHTGSLMLGIIGEHERMEGTVISDNVNFASRLEGLTKHYGASVLISEMTYSSLKNPERYLTRNLGKVRVKGKSEPITIYEVLDPLPRDIKAMRIKTRDVFEKGIILYQQKRFAEAIVKFAKILAVDKNDKAVLFYNSVASSLKDTAIADDDWDGTIEMREK
jgi:class 3 adenylate cyclase/HAMP domain-containing protein